VGIDGEGNNTVEQIGTEQDVVNGATTYCAWYEMYSTGAQQPEQLISNMIVMPGDSITASVQYQTSGAYVGQYLLSIRDNTRNEVFSTYQTSAATQNPLAQRSTAEWIVEAPGFLDGTTAPLANFGTVTFTGASATINGVTGPINAAAWQCELINMASGTVNEDSTSALTTSNGTSNFTIRFLTSAGSSMASTIATGSPLVSAQPNVTPVSAVQVSDDRTGRYVDVALTQYNRGLSRSQRDGSLLESNLAFQVGSESSGHNRDHSEKATIDAAFGGPFWTFDDPLAVV
jgi:hypothetical protein